MAVAAVAAPALCAAHACCNFSGGLLLLLWCGWTFTSVQAGWGPVLPQTHEGSQRATAD